MYTYAKLMFIFNLLISLIIPIKDELCHQNKHKKL